MFLLLFMELTVSGRDLTTIRHENVFGLRARFFMLEPSFL